MKEYYRKRQEAIRNEAIEWQYDFENHDYSWGELVWWQQYFERLGRRYGLLQEFRNNCII